MSARHLSDVMSPTIVVTLGMGLIGTKSTPMITLDTGMYFAATCSLCSAKTQLDAAAREGTVPSTRRSAQIDQHTRLVEKVVLFVELDKLERRASTETLNRTRPLSHTARKRRLLPAPWQACKTCPGVPWTSSCRGPCRRKVLPATWPRHFPPVRPLKDDRREGSTKPANQKRSPLSRVRPLWHVGLVRASV